MATGAPSARQLITGVIFSQGLINEGLANDGNDGYYVGF
jgi:hypothetical protein